MGCRKRAPDAELLRTVARPREPEGFTVVPDHRRAMAGRGAWVHPDPHCIGEAIRRRAFGRALRIDGKVDTSELSALLAAW